jgi:hypothetical protein
METIKIKIAGKQNLSFFISLIEKLNFIKEYKVAPEKKVPQEDKNASIEWATKEPNIDDFAGFWKDNPITIDDIRKKGWKRN